MAAERLLLFDVDGTLVDTGGAGMAALVDATREVFGGDGPELDLAGSTDSGLLKGIYAAFGVEESEETTARFFDLYLGRLEENLGHACFGGRALEGVLEIIRELEDGGVTKGLLTGNIAAGAEAKMRSYGMEGVFPFGAFGDDHYDRNLLGPIALERARDLTGKEFSASESIIIGDTPKDIRCAQAIGARSVCVATGIFTSEQLRSAGADVVFEDFAKPDEVLSVLLG